MQDAVHVGSQQQVVSLFDKQSDSAYLLRMAERCGGLTGLKVAVFPTPKGWEETGKYWATFHAWQELEQDHDPVFQVVETPQGLELGSEIPEWDCGGRVDSAETKVQIYPEKGDVQIDAYLRYVDAKPGRSLLFRLNDNYSFDSRTMPNQTKVLNSGISMAVTTLDEKTVASAAPDSFRIGGLLVVNPSSSNGAAKYSYWSHLGGGVSYSSEKDQVAPDKAYITSNWIPSLGRLPFKSSVEVTAPSDWVLTSEGAIAKPPTTMQNGYSTRYFRCDFPISYPKVCGGKYILALEGKQNGHILRSYQFAPIDKERAINDVAWMKKAVAFYETELGPFPFKEYDCFDGSDYYGIESYSYTILAPSITTWAVSHEMGHTYFGGLAPCAYVKDTWNEGVTQYVDSVLMHQSPEVTRMALAQVGVTTPLTEMAIPWENDNATYFRGGYAMQMLDAEIGHDKVMAALRSIIKERVGKETNWPDLRQYFEKASGQDLKWFWDQWISNGVFPHVTITSAVSRREGKGFMTKLTVKQTGTENPFRLRLNFKVNGAAVVDRQEVMESGEQTFEIGSDFEPKKVSIDPASSALISVDPAVAVVAGP